MKAAAFDYLRAHSIDEVCRALAEAGGDGKIIAGGQTLVPLLVMRLARPALVVDINKLAELQGIEQASGGIVIKAATRQAEALVDPLIAREVPLLAKALSHVGHPQTRNRGTIGGSLANADPAAEIGLAARILDAEIAARSLEGERRIAIADFFAGAMTTSLAAEECLTAIRFPRWREGGRRGTGFAEMSIRQSDFALVAVGCQLVLDEGGICRRIALGIGGAETVPVRIAAAEARLTGTRLEGADVEAALAAMQEALTPLSDTHASADYRRRVASGLAARTIAEARDEALAARG